MSPQAALRRIPRPTGVYPCTHCQEALGKNYPACQSCYQALECHWLADWHAFLSQEQMQANSIDEQWVAEIIFDEGERHLWTILDIAMTFLTCNSCGNELGGGPTDCPECSSGWGVTLWAETLAGRESLVTYNEHALHIGRMILRHPHRQSANIIAAWSRTIPRLLTGWLPTTEYAQHYMALIKAGRMGEVDAALAELDQTINES